MLDDLALRVDRVVVCSRFLRDCFAPRSPSLAAKTSVVFNGVNREIFFPREEIRQRKTIFFVGRLDAEKGVLWRHLDTCQYQTILHAEPPRSDCPEHGVRGNQLPWAEPSSRFTALFESAGDRLAEGGQPEGRGRAVAAELGRDPRHHGAGGAARIGAAAKPNW